jgi:predicted nucleic acid-binding protein
MTALVFVDSNVLLYWRDATEPAKQQLAADWLTQLWRTGTGRTSCQVLNEFYVNATRKLKPGLDPDEAWDDVNALARWNPLPVSVDLLARSREIERRHRLSWWDSLIVAAAQAQNCVLLLSEDFQDGASFGSVVVRSPFTSRISDAAAEYPASPLRYRHPPRGRPRKVALTEAGA